MSKKHNKQIKGVIMKNRINIIVTILIAFLVTATVFSQQRQRDKIQMRNHFTEELNLTEQQQSKIDELRLQNQKDMIDLKAELQKKKIELKELMQKGNYTRDEFLEKSNGIIAAENKIELARANHRMDVYEQLDENQKTLWNKKGFGKKNKWEKYGKMKNRSIDAE